MLCRRSVAAQRRFFSSSNIVSTLSSRIQALAEQKTPQFQSLKKEHGWKHIGDVNVEMAMGGMRGIKAMVYETSTLDNERGILYRDRTLDECMEQLPKANATSKVGLPEAAYWLLLTNEIPTDAEMKAFNAELHSRAVVPANVLKMIDNLDKSTHPMTQLAIALLALQPGSTFATAYHEGVKKTEYWNYALEDSLTLIAQIPVVAARIYRNVFFNGEHIAPDTSLDWAGNYAHMLGVNDSEQFKDAVRLYLMIHADHEGGNVSAHATHLVGSALSDPYTAYAAGVCGLAGPLHGLANQECLRWLKNTREVLGNQEPTAELLTQFAKDTLAAGKVIPGFGHGVLRITDPRYTIQQRFAQEHFPNDPLFKLSQACLQAIPPVLAATGKVKNPWPNVDALSGTCMQYYGLNQEDYFTVVFAVSRALGCTSGLVWSRRMGMPIERPKSVTLDWLSNNIK
mmetsp:Transcript_44255/g.94238  ORF Transcript_44255/g.94238 Transcript_44255/m.94238 type:complete len:455 (+) Transcript_44255:39-1403(+)